LRKRGRGKAFTSMTYSLHLPALGRIVVREERGGKGEMRKEGGKKGGCLVSDIIYIHSFSLQTWRKGRKKEKGKRGRNGKRKKLPL